LVAFLGPAEAGYQLGISAAVFYTAAYAAMNVGAFCIVSHLAGSGERTVTLDDYAGLSRRAPWLAAMLAIFLLSLIGIPATGGFFAKFYVFNAALKANLVGLTIIGVANSAVASYYYLRLIVVMYMREPGEAPAQVPRLPWSMATAVALCAAATLYLGIWPNRVLDYALRGAQQLMR
jgi:NADH-quinone oxidoreductase subunit N